MGKFTNPKDRFQKPFSKNTPAPKSVASDSFFVKPATVQHKNADVSSGRKFQNKRNSNNGELPKTDEEKKARKPFNKKKWREQKYSLKHKVDQWKERRNKAVIHGYFKNVKQDDTAKEQVKRIYEQEDDRTQDGESEHDSSSSKPLESNSDKAKLLPSKGIKPYKKAHLEFLRIKEEKEAKKREKAQKKAEKEEALEKYRTKKKEKFKKLSRKNKRGQPIMKERIEMLLEKIKETVT